MLYSVLFFSLSTHIGGGGNRGKQCTITKLSLNYHRILKKIHILIDLKIAKFDHSDAGQMNVYLNYYKDNELSDADNPSIELILCGNKDKTVARYATSGMDNRLFVSKYVVQLPNMKILENFIKKRN
jgi:hypothetical protein